MLDQVASASLPTGDENSLPNPVPMVTASWPVVEGVKLSEEDGELDFGGKMLRKAYNACCWFFSGAGESRTSISRVSGS